MSTARALASVVALAALAAAGLAPSLGCRTSDGTAPEESPAAKQTKVRFVPAPPGDVPGVVLAAMNREKAAGRRLVVYEGATWCEPCQHFHEAVASGKLDATFPDVTFLEFDLDKDRERLVASGYVSQYIPLFALPGKDGRPLGPMESGGIKGDGVVPYLSNKLRKLLAQGGAS